MPRRKGKKHKRKYRGKSTNKKKKEKDVSLKSLQSLINSISFDQEQTEDDMKDVEMARQIVYQDLCVNSELDKTQKNIAFGKLLAAKFKHYFLHVNTPSFAEINIKVPQCHDTFGRGALVAIFAKPSHVSNFILDNNCVRQYSLLVGHKLNKMQIIKDAKFVWLPLSVLNTLFPPSTETFAKGRANYAMEMFYYCVACIHVDVQHNGNYIMQEWMTSNDISHKEQHEKLQNYIGNKQTYSTKKFMKKFPQFNMSFNKDDK
eukprot:177665_1